MSSIIITWPARRMSSCRSPASRRSRRRPSSSRRRFSCADAATIENPSRRRSRRGQRRAAHDSIGTRKSAKRRGTYARTVTFEVGNRPGTLAAGGRENQVAIRSAAALPQQVLQQGGHGGQAPTADLLAVASARTNPRSDYLFLFQNYADVKCLRRAGTGERGSHQVVVFGAREYGMRIWPRSRQKLARLAVTHPGMSTILTEQERGGSRRHRRGRKPALPGQQMQLRRLGGTRTSVEAETITAQHRSAPPGPTGAIVHLHRNRPLELGRLTTHVQQAQTGANGSSVSTSCRDATR